MAKEVTILVISVITLFVAGFIAYTVNDFDSLPETQHAIAEFEDFAKEFDSIQSSIERLEKKLENLEADTVKELNLIKTELSKVKGDEPINNQKSTDKSDLNQIPVSGTPFNISLNKISFTKDEPIIITSQNILSQYQITIQLLSSFEEIISTRTAHSDAGGKLAYSFEIPKFIPAGDYIVKATYGKAVDEILIKIIETPAEPEKKQVSQLTYTLNKEKYKAGDIIRVTGVGLPSTPIKAELIDPDNTRLSANSSASSDGDYTIVFLLDLDAVAGKWILKITQGELVETTTVIIEN